MNDWLGGIIGNYRIEAALGVGGMGRVYRAVHIHINRVAAVKVLHDQIAIDPAFQARFLREAQAVAALHHPNIVDILDFNEDKGVFYLVMEYVPDGSLRSLLKQHAEQRRPMPLATGLDLIFQAADALDYAHRSGMVHRDIKPDNLLLKRDPLTGKDIVKVADFGLARLGDSATLTAEGQAMGTPAYMSPEQCQGIDLDGRSDIYSLGVVLYEVATGAVPFVMKSLTDAIYKHVYVAPPSPRDVRPEMPGELSAIILRCMAKNPDDRFATAGELAAALSRVIRAGVQDAPLARTYVEPVAPVEELRVVLDTGEVPLTPGQVSDLRVTLVNLGQTPIQASISIEGVPEEWIVTPSRDVQIAPGAEVSGPLRVQVPASAGISSGEYPVIVRASVRENPAVRAEATTRLVVRAVSESHLALVPAVASGRRSATFQIELRNDGSQRLELAPIVYSEQHDLQFNVDPPSAVVDPGRTASVVLTVTGSDRWIGRREQTHHFQVGAAGGGQPPVDGRFVQGLAMPAWLPPLYVLLLALAIGGIAYGLLRSDDPGDDDDDIAGDGSATVTTTSSQTATSTATGDAATSATTPTAVVVVDPGDDATETQTDVAGVTETPTETAGEPATETPAPTELTESIIFSAGRNLDDPAGSLDIYQMNPDGSNQRPLISGPDDDWLAAISPDGTRVAWVSRQHGNHQIYVMKVDGSDPRRLTTSAGDDLHPLWSPDGVHIIFVRNEDGDDELYKLNVDDGTLLRLTDNDAYDGFAAWSPDGTRIAWTSGVDGNNEIYLRDITDDAAVPQRLTTIPENDFNPVWSPDGTKLAFVSNRFGDNDIFVMQADGSSGIIGSNRASLLQVDSSQVTQLTSDSADEFAPAWSPDGTRIAFCRKKDNAVDVIVVNADGSGEQLVAIDASPNDPDITWSPDSGHLAYLSEDDGNYDIWTVALDGSAPLRLTDASGNDANLTWFAPTSASQ